MTANLTTGQPASAAEQSSGEFMSVNEAIARFRGEWVLMKVTEYDEDHWPSRGYVIAHSPEREGISEALRHEPPRGTLPPEAPRLMYYVFLAYPRARSLAEYKAMGGDDDLHVD
jgi:hypothetical protein